MHVTGVAIHRAGPLRKPDGGLDVRAYRQAVEAVLHRVPRYRQKLRWIPFERHPVWVDDAHFHLDYHIRHASLPRPGRAEELKKKAARIMVQPLDRGKPLWEHWVIEGLEGDRFAVIRKVHHCMQDGATAPDLVQLLMSPDPEPSLPRVPRYVPRPEPTSGELVRGALRRRLRRPFEAAARLRELRAESEDFPRELVARARALAEQLARAGGRVAETPLSGAVGPHRRIDWLAMSLADSKAVHRALGCTFHDLVLATVAGAVRSFFLHRHVDPAGVEFRVSAPVGSRAGAGRRVSPWMLRLPIHEPEPLARVEAIREETSRLRESRQALGVETILAVAEWTPSVLLSLGARALANPMPAHLALANIPGPREPLYLLGCELLEWYGGFPLMQHTGLGIALVSYHGRVCWSFQADRDLVPDLAYFARAVEGAFGELGRAAEVDVKGLPAEASAGASASARGGP
jgi:WS/DGAT/MGAT family acyltransferase